MESRIEYRGRSTPQLHLRALWRHRRVQSWRMVVFAFGFPVGMSTWALVSSRSSANVWWVFAWSLAFPFVVAALEWRLTHRLYRRDPVQGQPVHGELTEEGMTAITSVTSTHLAWALFKQVYIFNDLILLCQNSNAYQALPREFFETDDEWRRAAALVREKVGVA